MPRFVALILSTLFFVHATAQQTSVQYLSGTDKDHTVQWDFFCDKGMNSGKWTTIAVPSNWEQQSFGGYSYGHDKVKTDDKGVNPADVNIEEKIYDNGNTGGVSSRPNSSTVFTLTKTTYITRIENYHYFNNGIKPGTITLQSSSGQRYGPWPSYG